VQYGRLPQIDSPAETGSGPVKKQEPLLVDKPILKKSLIPTEEQLAKLELNVGENDIRFSVRSTLQGEQQVVCKLFFYPAGTKFVISDIDGTITRSDVMGHVMPRLGSHWAHEGVAALFQSIAKNGY